MSEVSNAVATGAHRVDKDASSNQDPHAEHHVPMTTYTIIIILLMVGLIITVIAAFIPLGELNMIVAMAIASVKALLVMLYFMHVKFASRLTKVFVAASFLWLAILFALTWPDYLSRGWLSNSRGWEDNPVKNAYREGTAHSEHGAGAGAKHTGSEGEAHKGAAAPGQESHGAGQKESG
jgi:cytochrome c oxidase subunit 4